MGRGRAVLLVIVVVLFGLGVAGSAAASSPPATAFGLGYDDLGRLVEASAPASSSAFYQWDFVGNLKCDYDVILLDRNPGPGDSTNRAGWRLRANLRHGVQHDCGQ